QGPHRWLNRVRLLVEDTADAPEPEHVDAARREHLRRLTHRTIATATERIEQFKYNTMITALMEFTNELQPGLRDLAGTPEWRDALSVLVCLLAPIAPYLTEELWERMGQPYSVHVQPWPEHDPALLVEETSELVVQVNGKVRDHLTLPRGVAEAEAVAKAQDLERVRSFVNGKQIVKVVYVPNRLINFVIR
ncbi:MAG TPA: class I tRNA ligase family protein, partial [Dehalococcoidia bacterium]|nr:class I tRNA ligase family protein [Dehalococcoidia bacterium]